MPSELGVITVLDLIIVRNISKAYRKGLQTGRALHFVAVNKRKAILNWTCIYLHAQVRGCGYLRTWDSDTNRTCFNFYNIFLGRLSYKMYTYKWRGDGNIISHQFLMYALLQMSTLIAQISQLWTKRTLRFSRSWTWESACLLLLLTLDYARASFLQVTKKNPKTMGLWQNGARHHPYHL